MAQLDALRNEVCQANRNLAKHGLAALTWGNASGINADRTRVVIKPSGVEYDALTPTDMVVVDPDGRVVEGKLRPSSDTPTHLALYRAFVSIGGVVHVHSPHATAFAQARRPISCFGTTHADLFNGPVPVTRALTAEEVAGAYEANTGCVIVECFEQRDPDAFPGVLVAGHGPFVWGASVTEALRNAVALETIAGMALETLALDEQTRPLEPYLLDKHHQRKHGTGAYYGQK
jgi:L-ribulose-5-phosphate 4-epimerase